MTQDEREKRLTRFWSTFMTEKKSRWGRTAATVFFSLPYPFTHHCSFHDLEMGAVGLQEGEETRSCADLSTVCSLP